MYATFRYYSGGSELADALVGKQSEIKDLIAGIAGFHAYYLVRTADGTVTVSIYEDEASADESNRVAAAWIQENLPDLSISAPKISSGEVAISL